MDTPLVDVICGRYGPKVQGLLLIEQINTAEQQVVTLYMDQRDSQSSFEIHASPSTGAREPLKVSNRLMADCVSKGQPFLLHALEGLGAFDLLTAVADAKHSADQSDRLGSAIVSEWGTISLEMPQDDADFRLKVRIQLQGRQSIKKSFPIDAALVADAVAAHELPLFAALRNCDPAAKLFADHDEFLRAVVEQGELSTAANKPGESSARRPRTL